MEVAFPKRKPIPASKRMVAPVSTPIHLILEAAEQDLLTRSLVKMRTMGGNAGSTYPGSFDFDREKKSRQKPAQQSNSEAEAEGLRVRQSFAVPLTRDHRKIAIQGREATRRTGTYNHKGWMCWNSGTRERLKLCSSM